MKKASKLFIAVTILLFFTTSLALFAQSSGSTGGRGGRGSKTASHRLTISTNVKSAEILVNGQPQNIRAPGTLTLPAGTYNITLRAKGHGESTARVTLNSDTSVTINLKAATYRLTINSNNRGARIFINGQRHEGRLPYAVDLKAGQYTVTLRQKGYQEATVNVNLNRNQQIFINMQTGSHNLTIDSNVKNAQLLVDGVPHRAKMPYTLSLSPGNYTITLKKKGYRDATTRVNLNKDQQVFISMDTSSYNLTVNANVPSGDIVVNNSTYAVQFPHTLSLNPGTYTVTVRAAGYKNARAQVDLQSDQSISLNLMLNTFNLTVESNVPDARLFINDERYATALPYTANLIPGTYTVSVRHQDYRNVTSTVNVEGNQSIYIELEPKAFDLSIQSNIQQGQVSINGEVYFSSFPYTVSLQPGNYELVVSADGYFDAVTSVALNSNQNVFVNLDPETYNLTVKSNAKNAIIFINGVEQTGSVPYTVALTPGRYTILVEADGRQQLEQSISFSGNQQLIMNFKRARKGSN